MLEKHILRATKKILSSAHEQSGPVFFLISGSRNGQWEERWWAGEQEEAKSEFCSPSAPSIMRESCPVTEKVHTNHGREYSS